MKDTSSARSRRHVGTESISPPTTIRRFLRHFLRWSMYHWSMNLIEAPQDRPDIVAATRGGDNSQGMDREGDPSAATLEQALHWRNIYSEILTMEESVLERIRQLMASQSAQARREVELTNVPVCRGPGRTLPSEGQALGIPGPRLSRQGWLRNGEGAVITGGVSPPRCDGLGWAQVRPRSPDLGLIRFGATAGMQMF